MKTKYKPVHYQSTTALIYTACGLINAKITTHYLDDVTCDNCRRNKVFKARVRLEITAKKIREREQLNAERKR